MDVKQRRVELFNGINEIIAEDFEETVCTSVLRFLHIQRMGELADSDGGH